ncbi:hypothetical protein [Paramagnetospirillum magnetotacticum]|nr:hypothetical protein [Paramagnetospirillum magnetotacticum]
MDATIRRETAILAAVPALAGLFGFVLLILTIRYGFFFFSDEAWYLWGINHPESLMLPTGMSWVIRPFMELFAGSALLPRVMSLVLHAAGSYCLARGVHRFVTERIGWPASLPALFGFALAGAVYSFTGKNVLTLNYYLMCAVAINVAAGGALMASVASSRVQGLAHAGLAGLGIAAGVAARLPSGLVCLGIASAILLLGRPWSQRGEIVRQWGVMLAVALAVPAAWGAVFGDFSRYRTVMGIVIDSAPFHSVVFQLFVQGAAWVDFLWHAVRSKLFWLVMPLLPFTLLLAWRPRSWSWPLWGAVGILGIGALAHLGVVSYARDLYMQQIIAVALLAGLLVWARYGRAVAANGRNWLLLTVLLVVMPCVTEAGSLGSWIQFAANNIGPWMVLLGAVFGLFSLESSLGLRRAGMVATALFAMVPVASLTMNRIPFLADRFSPRGDFADFEGIPALQGLRPVLAEKLYADGLRDLLRQGDIASAPNRRIFAYRTMAGEALIAGVPGFGEMFQFPTFVIKNKYEAVLDYTRSNDDATCRYFPLNPLQPGERLIVLANAGFSEALTACLKPYGVFFPEGFTKVGEVPSVMWRSADDYVKARADGRDAPGVGTPRMRNVGVYLQR